MKLKRVNLIFLFIFIISSNSFSQITINKPAQGCASVTLKQIIGADTVDFSAQQLNNGIKLTCDTTERTLIPIGFAPGNPYYETGYYTQVRIPFIPPAAFDAGQKLVLPNDDCWSQYFSFDNFYPSGGTNDAPPFTFYFYDKAYNILLANSNGGICFFDENLPLVKHAFANGIDLVNPPTYDNYICCPYDLSKPFPDADRKWDCTAGGCDDYKISPVMNSINGPFQDINYGAAMGDAGMYINFIGEYPCRCSETLRNITLP